MAKKIARALGRGEVRDAARIERNLTPRLTLDHIIKERYPTFVDALRDLDDALSMLFLFANLPSSTNVPPKTIALCQRLCLEFQHYLIVSRSLRRSFLSIKGIYYQATIQGQDILWLVPYKFVQQVTGDIDFRIMGTFVEFYTTLLGFVNFRLFTSVGLIYPPKFDQASDESGGELGAFALQTRNIENSESLMKPPYDTGDAQMQEFAQATNKAQETIKNLTVASPSTISEAVELVDDEADETTADAIDRFEPTDPSSDTLTQPGQSDSIATSIFVPHVFYLSRETPRAPLEFLLKSFGCRRVGWDTVLGDGAFTSDEMDSRITHQVVDRPPMSVDVEVDDQAPATSTGGRVPGRTYVQPQWVWDCVNAGKLLRPDIYAPGATLPPHLSPFVKAKAGVYDPSAPLDADDLAAMEVESDEEEIEQDESVMNGLTSAKKTAELNSAVESEDEMDEDDDTDDMDEALPSMTSAAKPPIDDDFEGFSSNDEDEETAQNQRELAAEAAGTTLAAKPLKAQKASAISKAQKNKSRQVQEKEEEVQRQKMMLSRRKRKLFEKMQYSNAQTNDETEKLKAKRRKIERAQAKAK